MSDSEAKKRWMRENTVVKTLRFTRNTEQDLLDYLEDKPTATVIKAALREYMERHPDEQPKKSDSEKAKT